MTIALFDVQTGFGGLPRGKANCVPLEDLLDDMKRLEFAGALVRVVPDEMERDWPAANAMLFEACTAHKGLIPCPVIVPASGGDYPPEEEQVREFIAHGACAAWIRPEKDTWVLQDWMAGPLFSAMEERRLPAFCLERDVALPHVADLASRYPALPIILAGVGYTSLRIILALLEAFPNVSLSIGNRFTVQGGIERVVSRLGAERLLFGTGFPDSEAMMAVTSLLYADITDEAKAAIGSGNFSLLAEGIER